MSFLTDIFNSVRAGFSQEADEQIKSREMRDKVMEAVHKASEDGTITVEEINGIKGLMSKLDIKDSELADIKIKVLRDLTTHILHDQAVKGGEMELLSAVEDALNFKTSEIERLKEDIAKVKALAK
jgi:hypothetical protein